MAANSVADFPGPKFYTRRSNIPYVELPDGFGISSQDRGQHTATRLCLVDWPSAISFMQDLVDIPYIVNTTRLRDPDLVPGSDLAGLGAAEPDDLNSGVAPGWTLGRLIPESHPILKQLTVSGVELVKGVGYPGADFGPEVIRFFQNTPSSVPQRLPLTPETAVIDPNTGATVAGFSEPGPDLDGFAKVRVYYDRVPYVTQVDDLAMVRIDPGGTRYENPIMELVRFCSRHFKPNVRSIQVGGTLYYLVAQAGDPGPNPFPVGNESPSKPLPFGEYRVTWHRVPMPGPPFGAMTPINALAGPQDPVLGSLNDAPFDFEGVSSIGKPFPTGTLLMMGVECSEPYWDIGSSSPYIERAGALTRPYTDIGYVFAYQPQGWQNVWRRGVGFRQVVRPDNIIPVLGGVPIIPAAPLPLPLPNNKGMYNFTNFGRLFKIAKPDPGPAGTFF